MALSSSNFQSELEYIFKSAVSEGEFWIVVRSGDLHRRLGDYSGPNHRMPICCNVMRKNMKPGDEIVEKPPKDNGANLKISYRLPR
ncbi:MAG: HNH endonuclease [Deltaproteobacteria bacterium]|nr:HNH endonuclease [Deltaproteobacteria bacterium]